MKRSLFILLAFLFMAGNQVFPQGILKKVTKSMTDELLGKTPSSSSAKPATQPEPASACKDGLLVLDLGGKLQLMYSEINISTGDDGSILFKDMVSGDYYIARSGNTTGPIKPGDPRLASFNVPVSDDETEAQKIERVWKGYITKTGEKLTINFGGKTYGPYAIISSFLVTKSKDKFAAIVTENVAVTEKQGKAMDEEMKKAKTDQEKMDLAMKYAAQMQQSMMQNGGPQSTTPKLITNIPGVTFNPLLGGTMKSDFKYDEILVDAYSQINDLKGNKVLTLPNEIVGTDIFISSDNSKWASFQYGALNFSDKTSLPELFNPNLVKVDGKVFLSYMYYSPKKNSIMECRIPF
jgi:hypothetical protein